MTGFMFILYSAVLACLQNLAFVPIIIWIARRNKWYDEVNERKIHKGNIPRLGGIGIFLSFAVTLCVASLVFIKDPANAPWGPKYWPVAISFIVIHFMGLADDFKNLRARFRFAIQLCVAVLVVASGFRFDDIYLPFLDSEIALGWVAFPLSVIWIVGITNSINLIDGMDGLCGGISLLASCVYGIIYIEQGFLFPALTAFILAGAIAGYLFYNFPPAKIFMGDSGSTLLGFAIAVLPLMGKADIATGSGIGIWSAITITLIPIFDTFAAMWRRKRAGVSFFTADKYHLHHKLLNLGFSTRQILAITYASCLLLGTVAISSLYVDKYVNWILIMISWAIYAGLFFLLHYMKEKNVVLIKDK